MAIEWTTLIEGGIPILGGLYATALGHGLIAISSSQPGPLKQKRLDRLRWLGPFVVLFGIFTAWQAHVHATHPPAEELARLISSRLTLPAKVDDITQTVGVRGTGDNLIYDYSVTASLPSLGGREKVQRTLEQYWLATGCKNKDLQKLLSSGYTLQMHYSFQGSPEEILVSLSPRSCGH